MQGLSGLCQTSNVRVHHPACAAHVWSIRSSEGAPPSHASRLLRAAAVQFRPFSSCRSRPNLSKLRPVQATASAPPKDLPKEEKIKVDEVQVTPVTKHVTAFRSICTQRLKFEIEYGLKRGTTDNCYVIQENNTVVLVDVPDQAFTDDFVSALERFISLRDIQHLVVTQLTPKHVPSIKAFLQRRNTSDNVSQLQITLSNPAKQVLKSTMEKDEEGSKLLQAVNVVTAKTGTTVTLSEDSKLQLIPVPTPRWPDLLCVYHRTDRLLFTSNIFSAHVAPSVVNTSGESAKDVGGWDMYGQDWRHYFDCMLAPVAKQAAGGLDKLADIISPSAETLSTQEAAVGALQKTLKSAQAALEGRQAAVFGEQAMSSGGRMTAIPLTVNALCPSHGPVVQSSLTELLRSYQKWTTDQIENAKKGKIAVLYASAYGNTAGMAQAISRGITKAGIGVETLNLEEDSVDDALAAVKEAKGFIIGSPTLGGHLPTQVQTALGAIVRESSVRDLPCGVFGSFGWSGEAVDELENRLKDAGFSMAFKPIRVKFKPSAKDVQVCEESGVDLAQAVHKAMKVQERQAGSSQVKTGGASGVEQAVGRLVGSLCVVTGRDEDAESAMLASWVSQASFDPPGLSIAVKKDRAVETLLVMGNKFNVNVLAQGNEKAAVKQMLKPFKPAEDRFEGLDTDRSEENDCVFLKEAAAYVGCTIKDRLEAGDHWIIYATVDSGKVLTESAPSAVHHRKIGTSY